MPTPTEPGQAFAYPNEQAQWLRTLDSLQLQMPKSTFENWLQGTWVVSVDGDTYTIGVKSPNAKEWLDHRLNQMVTRALSTTLGQPAQVKYTVVTDLPTTEMQPEADLAVSEEKNGAQASPVQTTGFDAVTFVQQTNWRPIRDQGYTPVSNYGSIFWQAWLNKDNCRTYGLWLGIQTYDKRPTFNKDFHDFWTPARSFRIRELTAAIGAGNSTPALTGRFTDCAYCRKALEAGTPLTRCCGAHTPTRWKTLDQEQQVCQYWSLGAFECLQNAGLLGVEVKPGSTNSHQLKLQVWRLLPVLTPHQVSRLPAILQIRHEQWLNDYGHLFNLTLEQWEQISLSNLVPHMPHYAECRQLGTYVWNKIERERLAKEKANMDG